MRIGWIVAATLLALPAGAEEGVRVIKPGEKLMEPMMLSQLLGNYGFSCGLRLLTEKCGFMDAKMLEEYDAELANVRVALMREANVEEKMLDTWREEGEEAVPLKFKCDQQGKYAAGMGAATAAKLNEVLSKVEKVAEE
jgi:hypothetical protein